MNDKLELIKKELYGKEPSGSIDGYQVQIGNGEFDLEKYNKLMTLFKDVAKDIKTTNKQLSEFLGHYTNFAIDTVMLLLSREYENLDEVVKELENLF